MLKICAKKQFSIKAHLHINKAPHVVSLFWGRLLIDAGANLHPLPLSGWGPTVPLQGVFFHSFVEFFLGSGVIHHSVLPEPVHIGDVGPLHLTLHVALPIRIFFLGTLFSRKLYLKNFNI